MCCCHCRRVFLLRNIIIHVASALTSASKTWPHLASAVAVASACWPRLTSLIATLSLRHTASELFDFKNAVTLKSRLGVRQGHWACYHSI